MFSRTFYNAKTIGKVCYTFEYILSGCVSAGEFCNAINFFSEEFPMHMRECVQVDYQGRFYEDFYRFVDLSPITRCI